MAKAKTPSGPIVRISVPLDSRNHARLCALAALRSVERSAVAAEILKRGLKDVVVIDPASKVDPPGKIRIGKAGQATLRIRAPISTNPVSPCRFCCLCMPARACRPRGRGVAPRLSVRPALAARPVCNRVRRGLARILPAAGLISVRRSLRLVRGSRRQHLVEFFVRQSRLAARCSSPTRIFASRTAATRWARSGTSIRSATSRWRMASGASIRPAAPSSCRI